MGSQEYDQEIGLYHLGARYYDPMMGRFLSEDPIGIAGGLNLYAYADNDPIGGRDPSGLSSCRYESGRDGSRTAICTYTVQDCIVQGTSHDACNGWQFSDACARVGGTLSGPDCTVVSALAGGEAASTVTGSASRSATAGARREAECGAAVRNFLIQGVFDASFLIGVGEAAEFSRMANLLRAEAHSLGRAARWAFEGRLAFQGFILARDAQDGARVAQVAGKFALGGYAYNTASFLSSENLVHAGQVFMSFVPGLNSGWALVAAARACWAQ
jgi:RHS repeat-associated protein